MSMRKGHNYECFISGSDEALAYVESVYPDDCETLIIGGNHDYSFFKHHQQDLLKLLSRLRPDIHYLGMHKAAFRVNGIEVAMFHGSGMGAASNRLTRTYSNACRDGPMPDLVVNGHLHHWNLCPEYGKRKALLVQAACFQGTTQYERSIDKIPQIGGMVVWRDEEAEKMVYEIKNFDEVRHDHPGLIIDDYPEPIIDDS